MNYRRHKAQTDDEVARRGRIRPEEALAAFKKSAELDPTDPETWRGMAAILVELNRPEQALDALEAILKILSDDRDALEKKAGLLFHLKRYEDAIGIYDALISSDAGAISIWQYKGAALRAQGELLKARDCLRLAVGRNPGSVVLHQYLGELLDEIGDQTGAIDELYCALDLVVNDQDLGEDEEGLICSLLGRTLLKMQKYAEGEAYLRRAVKLRADSAALLSLADAMVRQNRMRDAETAIRHILARNQEDVGALMALSRIEREYAELFNDDVHHREVVRLSSLTLNCKLKPEIRARVYFVRGCSYAALKELRHSRSDFEKAALYSAFGSVIQVQSRRNLDRIRRFTRDAGGAVTRFGQLLIVAIALAFMGYLCYLGWVKDLSNSDLVAGGGVTMVVIVGAVYGPQLTSLKIGVAEIAKSASSIDSLQLETMMDGLELVGTSIDIGRYVSEPISKGMASEALAGPPKALGDPQA